MKFGALLKRFGSAKDAWNASRSDLDKTLGEKLAEKFDKFRMKFGIARYSKQLKEKRVSFIILSDTKYPKPLKEIPNAPFVLYCTGNIDSLLGRANLGVEPLIAVVGTRKITNYGREVTELLVRELVANGLTIVSGLAIGIDSRAADTAIEAGGQTIAVLGCGVDCVTPSVNKWLYDKIVAAGGAIVSEFPLGQPPTKGSFLSRNRIIAGLSLGVLVTEGAEDSGALITADYALKFNRKVFAVPGPITSSLSKGPHQLLEKGAKLVTSGQDIINELGIKINYLRLRKDKTKIEGATKEEERILEILESEELHIDEIVRRSGFETGKVGSLLSIMEVKGQVRNVGGGVFSLSY